MVHEWWLLSVVQPTRLPARKPERSARSHRELLVMPGFLTCRAVRRVAGEMLGGPEMRTETPVTSLLGPIGRKQ